MYSDPSSNYLVRSNNEPPHPRSKIFNLITGEYVNSSVKCSEGSLTLSNYRLVLQFSLGTYFIPLGVIDQTEIRKVVCLHIHCKDARSYKCTFATSEQCLDWQKTINDMTGAPSNLEKIFAHTFYKSTLIQNPELHSFFTNQMDQSTYYSRSNKIFDDEVKRLGFDLGSAWRISKANENYKLCPSYPRRIIVPSSISDKALEEVARFRSSRRIPTVVWRHSNGAVIARSSQPEVGWLWWRSGDDEDLVKALAEACAYDKPSSLSPTGQQNQVNGEFSALESAASDRGQAQSHTLAISDLSSICDLPEAKAQNDIKKLLIMDARSYATAVANRARGGGCECLEYYPTCEIQFMSLDNIHTIRKSHQALRNIISLSSDLPNWLSSLENTRWLYHMSGLIKAAVTVAETVAVEVRPVLVHCSDGWDRTPQIIALAQILLDPYYRTFEGFQVLVEREWIEFGHKFNDRCGSGVGSEDLNERCPVFLQWIDCVHQILCQYPTVFQFNQAYLVKLAQHVYSNLFGTFLFNSSQERYQNEEQQGRNNLFSVWPLFKLHPHRYTNHLYSQSNPVLYPSFDTKDLVLWKAVYMNKMATHKDERFFATVDAPHKGKGVETVLESELVKTKSCDNLLKLSSSQSSRLTRRSSDPNLRESFPDLALLKSALGSEMLLDDCCDARKAAPSGEAPEHDPATGEGIDGGPNGVGGAKFASFGCQSYLQGLKGDMAKRSIEGSTDTLVSEEPSLRATPLLKEKAVPVHPAAARSAKSNGVPKGEEFLKKREERLPDEGYIASSMGTCSLCLKGKRKHSEPSEVGVEESGSVPPLANGIKNRHFSPPAHHLTSPTGIPSTPSEERYLQMQMEKSPCPNFSDGLPNYKDDVTIRLNQMRAQHMMEIESMRREMQAIKSSYYHLIHTKLNHANNDNHTEDQVSLPESLGSGSGDSVGPESSGLSDASWEAVEDSEARTTLWVPDHAVDSCMGCHSQFWIGRRRHHCRNCGKIFCAECSEFSVPIPKENLFDPVRVCTSCFSSLPDFRPKYVQVATN